MDNFIIIKDLLSHEVMHYLIIIEINIKYMEAFRKRCPRERFAGRDDWIKGIPG